MILKQPQISEYSETVLLHICVGVSIVTSNSFLRRAHIYIYFSLISPSYLLHLQCNTKKEIN
jgi:hypothetical protein